MPSQQLPQPGGGQRSQTKFIIFENFEKMNTQSIRQSLSEKELAWLENLQPIAPNNLMVVPAPASTALATITETISSIFYASISGVDYLICFTTAGSAYAITVSNGNVNHFAPDGTFSNPDVTTWQSTRILINDPTSGYCTWDGTLFVKQGGVSPNITVTAGGSGYGTAPSVTISGGSGSGVTAVAVVSGGAVVAVNLTNPGSGYIATDTLTVAFGTSPGSGASATANMTGAIVSSVTTTSPGNLATTPFTGWGQLNVSGGGGSGAAVFAFVAKVGNDFFVQAVAITAAGFGYTSAPSVTFPSGGSGFQPTFSAFIGTESVSSLTLNSGGSSYSAPPSVTISPPDGIGSGASGVTTESGGAVTSIALTASAVSSIVISNPGVFSSAPGVYSLSFSGGGGTGATGTATLGTDPTGVTGNTVVTGITITSGGSGYTSSPTVTVTASASTSPTLHVLIASQGAGYNTVANVILGTGSGATAIAHVWPFVPAGTTLAVFQGRVWLNGLNTVSGQNNILQWTGTGATYGNVGYDDFLAADASASLVLSDADLIHAITALRSLNNYLFIMGDQSVKQIGNISLNSAGDVTLFTILTLSSDQGTIYPKSCISYNRVFMFANSNGIYGVFGSSVQKLSSDMDGIFKLVNFSQVPQGALADINAIHNAVFLLSYNDPLSSTRSIIIAFDGKRWFVISQGNSLKAIATSALLSSGQLSLYGSSGPDVTNLLSNPAGTVSFKIQTALTHHGNALQGKKLDRAGLSSEIATASGVVTVTLDTEAGLGPSRTLNIENGFTVIGGSNDASNNPINASGVFLGMTITGTLAGYTFTNALLEYQETSLWKGA